MSSLSQARPLFAADEFDAQGVSDDDRGDGLMRAECAAIRVAYLVGTLPVDLSSIKLSSGEAMFTRRAARSSVSARTSKIGS